MNNQRFRVNTPTVTHETIDGEAVIINLDSGNYYSLVDVGSFIWGLVEKGASASEVQDLVLQTYQADAMDVDRGVQELLAQLEQENLIVPVDEAGPLDLTEVQPPNNGHEKPSFNPPSLHKYSDMQELLLLDPIHDVDDAGWPKPNPEPPK
ncbi:MAG TPA: PqqD family protein [Pyrinomonadaceae bacterium]|nr:PqqD family protein [Pyrinomonadaceae bacterium]